MCMELMNAEELSPLFHVYDLHLPTLHMCVSQHYIQLHICYGLHMLASITYVYLTDMQNP